MKLETAEHELKAKLIRLKDQLISELAQHDDDEDNEWYHLDPKKTSQSSAKLESDMVFSSYPDSVIVQAAI